jgi:hypothetical protein
MMNLRQLPISNSQLPSVTQYFESVSLGVGSWKLGIVVLASLVVAGSTAEAQVTRLEITSREPVASGQVFGSAGPYENIRGRIHGEVDPKDPHNRIIQDIDLAPRNARGKIEYIATFSLMKPADLSKSSGVLFYTVVNRGNGAATPSPDGHISLVSGWQGDVTPTTINQTIQVPAAKRADGGAVTGPVLARFYDQPAGTNTATIRIGSLGTGFYAPHSLDTSQATLTAFTSETNSGHTGGAATVPATDWAFADCRTTPFPGTPDPRRICLKNGFDPARLYQLAYTAKDPLVLGIGLAATRDIVSFFRHAAADSSGTPNPVAKAITHSVAFGASQSGNLLRTFIHLGFNQDLSGRMVWDGVFPYIAARQTPMNLRFAAPGGAAGLYEPGSEPAIWWGRYEDTARGRKAASLLDRCAATRTCPKIVEAFGAAEFWGLRMSPDLIGTDAKTDIPLPDNVRRYYMPGTTHGGGGGGFQVAQSPNQQCALPVNPNPMAETTRALTAALVEWVVKGTPPPPSRYPTLADRQLVPATRAAMGFPAIPGIQMVEVNPILDYDFGGGFDYSNLSGEIERQPPTIKRVLPTFVPRVNSDGNETSGIPSILHQAPLGTYLGWNVTASGFFKGQICGFAGGYVPFALTRDERLKIGDPRPSIEERYGTHEGYLCVVRRAADALVRDRFLLKEDAERVVGMAAKARILPAAADSTADGRRISETVCR